MSLLNTLQTGASGLRIASSGINVVSHNVTNATTEGYSRRSVAVRTDDPIERYGFGYGQGARITDVRRTTDFLVNSRYVNARGLESRASTLHSTLSAVENSFDEVSGSSMAGLLNEFFDNLNSLSMDPGDRSRRMELIDSGERLTRGFNEAATNLNATQDAIYEELSQSLAGVQEKLDQVAALNARVVSATTGLGKGDMQDQRDQLVYELAETLGGQVQQLANGQVNLLVGGHAVVAGPTARTLSVSLDAVTGLPRVDLSADSGIINVTNLLGGRFGGLVDASNATASYLTDLNTWVDTFATTFNTQHAAGFDRTGAPGGDFFTFAAGSEAASFDLDALLAADPDLIAAAGAATALIGDGANLSLLVDIEDQLVFAGGRTAADSLGDIFANVGRDVSSASLEGDRYSAQANDLAALRDAVSGVDLDEEATALMAWQSAYEASARVVSATNQLLDTLMNLGR